MNSFRHGGTIYILKNKDSDNVIENINKCDDVNNLLTIIDNVKENNNISNNDYSLIKNEYSKKYKEITNNNLSNKELNELFAKNSYELKDDGVYYHYEKNGNQLSIKICGYLTIEAITHDNNSRSFGRYLKFKNTLNVINYCYMPMSTLVDKSGAAHKELVDKGLYIENDCFNHVIKYINLASNLSSVQITNKIGWHNDSFVFADKTVGKQDIFYQSNSFNISNPYSELGTLEDWQQNISRYCVGNPLLMFAVSISFSGALLKLCEQPIGIGFHIYGASSKGKSTISNVAASVFGKPSGYIRNWRTTTNGLEGVAVAYNDSTLILDELSQIKPNELGSAIYMLINGSGRSRADRSGDAKNTKQWQISVLSNGEKSVATHSAEEQEDINAGQMIRLLNIPLWGKFGAFDSLHDLASGEELTKKLTSSYLKNHGVAGIKWIEALLSHSENYSKMLDVMIDDFKNEIDQYSLSLTSQDMRALNSFAVVALAGDLATAFGITKWKPRQSLLSAVQCFLNWKSSSAAVNDIVYTGADIENTKILQSMKNFLDVHGNSRFFDISNGYDKTKIIHNSAGFKKFGMDGQIMYIFNDISFKQAFKGHDLTIAINTFKDAGWLLFDVKRHKKSHCINGRTQKLYTIVIPDDGVVDSDEYVDDFFERPKKCVGWG
jgi:putative DNA primase/helicase